MAAQIKYELVKPGRYEFYISGIIDTNKDGKPLFTEKGNPYRRIRLTLIDKDDYCTDVYDVVFSSDKVREIFECVGKHVSSTTKIDLDHIHDLRGYRGYCMVGIKKDKNEKYGDQNNVKCYIPKSVWGEKGSAGDAKPRSPLSGPKQDDFELDADDVDFLR